MIALRNREMKLVIMKESKVCELCQHVQFAIAQRWLTPAPATPASVCTESGMTEQLAGASNIVKSGIRKMHAMKNCSSSGGRGSVAVSEVPEAIKS